MSWAGRHAAERSRTPWDVCEVAWEEIEKACGMCVRWPWVDEWVGVVWMWVVGCILGHGVLCAVVGLCMEMVGWYGVGWRGGDGAEC